MGDEERRVVPLNEDPDVGRLDVQQHFKRLLDKEFIAKYARGRAYYVAYYRWAELVEVGDEEACRLKNEILVAKLLR